MEQTNSKSEELQSILDGITDPLILIDSHLQIKRANKITLDFIHSSNFHELIHGNCYEMIYGRTEICPYCPFKKMNPQKPLLFWFKESENKKINREIYILREDKKQVYNLEFFPIETGGKTLSFVEKITDITDKKENEEENLQIRNLASLGIFISGVAHELNNPLTGIGLTLQNLINNLHAYKQDFILGKLDMIKKDLSRAAIIVADILSFSKPERLKSTPGNLNEIINNAYATVVRLYPVLAKGIHWKISCNSEIRFSFNPVKMERLFLNLFRNSLQAFNYSKGTIAVNCKILKKNIQITVEDDAGGISPKIIDKIFDPFFSKKDSGTGLGLSICYSIVKEHDGNIKVRSNNRKTTFIITLPIHEEN